MDEETGKICSEILKSKNHVIGERDKNESTYIPFTSESGRRRRLTDASVKGIRGEPGIAETEKYKGEDSDEHPAAT